MIKRQQANGWLLLTVLSLTVLPALGFGLVFLLASFGLKTDTVIRIASLVGLALAGAMWYGIGSYIVQTLPQLRVCQNCGKERL